MLMGKPKFSTKKYETPSHPWQEDRINQENELIKKFGLKNKKEIWKAQTRLRKYRGQARELLARVTTGDEQSKKESNQLLTHLNRFNVLPQNSDLDDVLALDIESILSRRLQTLTYLKGFANTPNQARQLIIHGHIAIGDRKITVPSYMVTKTEEGDISYTKDSALNDAMHPARPRTDLTKASSPKTFPSDEQKQQSVAINKKIDETTDEKKKDTKTEKAEDGHTDNSEKKDLKSIKDKTGENTKDHKKANENSMKQESDTVKKNEEVDNKKEVD
jgi:small subunit ribosomal protein S4